MSKELIYLDYAATTPADPRVIAAMATCLGIDGTFGNPASSSHSIGSRAMDRVEQARTDVAALIGARADEIVWTSGATESNNLALKGVAESMDARCHIVTSALEHKAVLDTTASLERRGCTVTYLAPDANAAITPEAVANAMTGNTAIVSLMMVNNEIGTLTDIASIAEVVRKRGALLHVDAAQALGKTPVDVAALGIDLMSLSAHKVYGPKGIGAMYVGPRAAGRVVSQIHGGGHERGLRSGTLATHQIVGMGEACAIAKAEMAADTARIRELADRFLSNTLSLRGVTQNARHAARVPHTLSITIGRDGFLPFWVADRIAVSSTSACNSAAGTPSHVLRAIGIDAAAARRTLRISLGRYTTAHDVDGAAECIERAAGS